MADLIETLARAMFPTILKWDDADPYVRAPYLRGATAALAALQAAGMVVVPVIPTQAMKDAAVDWCPLLTKEVWPDGSPRGIRSSLSDEECGELYTAMLSSSGGKGEAASRYVQKMHKSQQASEKDSE